MVLPTARAIGQLEVIMSWVTLLFALHFGPAMESARQRFSGKFPKSYELLRRCG